MEEGTKSNQLGLLHQSMLPKFLTSSYALSLLGVSGKDLHKSSPWLRCSSDFTDLRRLQQAFEVYASAKVERLRYPGHRRREVSLSLSLYQVVTYFTNCWTICNLWHTGHCVFDAIRAYQKSLKRGDKLKFRGTTVGPCCPQNWFTGRAKTGKVVHAASQKEAENKKDDSPI